MIASYLVIDTFIVRGIQNANVHNEVNPIYLDIGKSSNFNDFFIKYPNTRLMYRFQLLSITLYTNIANTDEKILIFCKGLKGAKKCDTNREEDTILGITHKENIAKFETVAYNI